jgi:predicted nucleic acid-binding protein
MLLDTSGLLSLIDPGQPRHQLAVDQYRQSAVWLTHGYVLSELTALGNARKVSAKSVVTYIEDLLVNTNIEVVWPDLFLTSRALVLMSSRLGAGYSLCDAVSFVLMRERGLTAALTTDAHFEQEGFQRLLT